MSEIENPKIYQFGEYQLDLAREMLRRNGEKVIINRRCFQVLKLLVERAGDVVGKKDFFEIVWADTFVEENVLTVTMTALRKALGDDPKQPKFIENLPRKGYRFIAEVEIRENQPEVKSLKTEKSISEPAAKLESLPTNSRQPPSKINRFVAVGVIGFCLLILFAVAGFNYSSSSSQIKSENNALQLESVAVLPFENQNPDTEYLSDGLTESLISSLSGLSNLRVISRNSVFQYKGKSVDSTTIGRELNVRAVLTGRFIQQGDDLIISAELTDVRDNKQIWGQQYNRKVADVFALQQEISRDISETLRKQLTGEQQRFAKRETDSPEAFQLYLKGRYFWNKRTDEGFVKAVDFFNQALEKDPTYALAYVGLANCYLSGSFKFTDTYPKRVAMVKAAIQKALEIDDTLGEAYAVLAINKWFYEWDFVNAEKDFKRAIELSPNYATAHHWYAELLAMEGRFDESFVEYNRALELDPLSLAINTDLGLNYFYARQPELAIDHLKKLKEIDSNYARTYLYLGQVYKGENMFEDSIAAYKNYSTLTRDNLAMGDDLQESMKTWEIIRNAYKTSGAKDYWGKLLEFALKNKRSDVTHMAIIYAQLGERDKAFEFLEKAYSGRSAPLLWVKVSPEFDSLRSDPRFADLVRRVGLPQ